MGDVRARRIMAYYLRRGRKPSSANYLNKHRRSLAFIASSLSVILPLEIVEAIECTSASEH
jgi:hypothetical protein